MSKVQKSATATMHTRVKSLLQGFALGAGSTALAAACIIGLYLAKSAAGIDLIEGPSPLHDALFHIVR